MNKEILNEVVEFTHELLKTPTCCQELKEDIMPIENLIAFADSKAGQDYFGEKTAKDIVVHSKGIQAQGAQYCDCPACAIVEKILKKCGEIK